MKKEERIVHFFNKAKLKHNGKYDYSKTIYNSGSDRITVICPTHGEFTVNAEKHVLRGDGCNKCKLEELRLRVKKRKIEETINKFNTIYNNKYDYSLVDFDTKQDRINIICKDHGVFTQRVISHLVGCGCPKCKVINRQRVSDPNLFRLINISKQIHGDKYSYDKVVYTDSNTSVIITCPIHGDFKQKLKNHIRGSECHKCVYEKQQLLNSMGKDKFIELSKERHNNQYTYEKVKYVNNKTPLVITCKEHGDFSVRPDSHLNSLAGCNRCSKSSGERKVMNLLKHLNLDYVREYSFNNSKFRYDFYLPALKIVIEYDGQHHFLPIEYFGGHINLIKTKERDMKKNKLAHINGCEIIRIPYMELNNLEHYFINKLSKIYKYYKDGVFYYTFLTLVKALNLPPETKPQDVEMYKTENIKLNYRDICPTQQ